MKKLLIVLTLAMFNLPQASARETNSTLSDEALLGIKFDQRLGAQISPGLQFRDEQGNSVALGKLMRGRPVILVLGYYECPMLCSLTLNGLIEAMQDLKMDVGREFDIINVSIDPRETPELAAAKKRTYLKRYGRKGADEGWRFLTGDETAIHQLTDEAGYHYAYDPLAKEFAHPSGLVILTPDGRISHYIFGVTFSPEELNTALRDAGSRRVGSPIQQLFLLCFHYSPFTGRYGHLIMDVVRVSGVATLAALSFLVFRSRPRWKKTHTEAGA
jgi:protein SCO1